MNAAHLHLMLNHLPVIGVIFLVPLLAWASYRQSLELLRVALAVSVAVALSAIAVYLTGEPAEETVEHLTGVATASIEAHEEAAFFAMACAAALGVLGLFGLWRLGGAAAAPRWIAIGSLVVALFAALSMARTANLGALIRHPEAAFDFVPPPEPQ